MGKGTSARETAESPFALSAVCYDTLYQDKDYGREAAYIHGLLMRYAPEAKSILEMGCGTLGHAVRLAKNGYVIHGFDRSEPMLRHASQQLDRLPAHDRARVSCGVGDLASYRAGRRFDAVLSLFHVLCYQTTNEDLEAAFGTASAHIERGGVFVFDAWYGPAVLTERPSVRIKRMENETVRIERTAEPQLLPNENRVDVAFTYLIEERDTGSVRKLKEMHRVRYLFHPEVTALMNRQGMDLVGAEEWLTGSVPSDKTWGVCFIGRKR